MITYDMGTENVMSFHNKYHAKSAVFPPKSSMITNMILILYNTSRRAAQLIEFLMAITIMDAKIT